jgi:hypothetical protein
LANVKIVSDFEKINSISSDLKNLKLKEIYCNADKQKLLDK